MLAIQIDRDMRYPWDEERHILNPMPTIEDNFAVNKPHNRDMQAATALQERNIYMEVSRRAQVIYAHR